METKPIDLYEFLVESELQQYYNSIKNELKISMVPHLKYATDEDLRQVGFSKPEIRRLRKFFEKYYPHGYLSKIKRLLQPPTKKDELTTLHSAGSTETLKTTSSPSKLPNNKHIIPADSICVNKELGVGEFGIVQQGVWTNGTERIQVAIKCLCRERMQSNPMEFLKEAAIMHSIEHENIVRLYGVVLDTNSLMLVTELAHLRSLLECLKDSGLRVSFLTVPTLCEFASQICNGMMYLESKRLIHRDLAARNILVFSKSKVKISDFGLSRALGVGKDYYQTNFNVNLKLPIAWCAPECINFLRFTNASDVWAYGVCLWEMFSYGFQPWAALTGHQILEAIDEPQYQRLEAPECCPKEYYALMLKCWQHDPVKRPKFNEIYGLLPDMKPEQLKTIISQGEAKKDHLMYRQSDIITVLDKPVNSPYWKGVLNSGKTGFFNPSNTVAYLGNSLPSSINRDSFSRGSERSSSKRKLCPEMISGPQNDLKHTGHVGLDGAYFGDVAFLSSSSSNAQSYNHVPRQIVTPYKPSEDIEQTPLLLPPTPTSPDSLQTASGYFPENGPSSMATSNNHSFISAHHPTARSNDGFNSSFDFGNHNGATSLGFASSNPFVGLDSPHSKMLSEGGAFTNMNMEDDTLPKELRHHKTDTKWPHMNTADPSHEYHEISDDEMPGEKFDLGPSLLDEMDLMFRSMNASIEHGDSKSPDFENTNKKNEIAEFTSKFNRKNGGGNNLLSGTLTNKSKKKSVKPISLKDEKSLNQALDMAECSARSLTDLASDSSNTQSPKRKFSFRFPHLAQQSTSMDKDAMGANGGQLNRTAAMMAANANKPRNFSEEIKNVPDLQSIITKESQEAYNSLVEKPGHSLNRINHDIANLKKHLQLSVSMSALQMPSTGPMDAMPMSAADSVAEERPQSPTTITMMKIISQSELKVPTHRAPRVNTLPYRSGAKMSRDHIDCDTNPLRILRDKNYPIVRPRMKVNIDDEPSAATSVNGENGDDVCESPSYLTTQEYTFSERDVNIHHGDTQKFIGNKEIENLNPIPLPPRDRNKVLLSNVKRHVRKHPLIIPTLSTGLQRTLSKVTTPVEEKEPYPFPTGIEIDDVDSGASKSASSSNKNNYNMPRTSAKPAEVMKFKSLSSDHSYMNQEDINVASPTDEQKVYAKKFIENNFATYENLDAVRVDNTDSASLHFESILESDINPIDEGSSHGVLFELRNGGEHYDVPRISTVGDDASFVLRRNSTPTKTETPLVRDAERKRLAFSQKYPNYSQPKNELTDNALFNKFRESADSNSNGCAEEPQTTEVAHSSRETEGDDDEMVDDDDDEDDDDDDSDGKLKDSNSVSCEDLLEFAKKKPNGKERGIDSDEVRIMTKVLGKIASPEQYIIALDCIEWNVHRAIKMISLQNALKEQRLVPLDECVQALQKYEWDLHTTTLKLNMQQQ